MKAGALCSRLSPSVYREIAASLFSSVNDATVACKEKPSVESVAALAALVQDSTDLLSSPPQEAESLFSDFENFVVRPVCELQLDIEDDARDTARSLDDVQRSAVAALGNHALLESPTDLVNAVLEHLGAVDTSRFGRWRVEHVLSLLAILAQAMTPREALAALEATTALAEANLDGRTLRNSAMLRELVGKTLPVLLKACAKDRELETAAVSRLWISIRGRGPDALSQSVDEFVLQMRLRALHHCFDTLFNCSSSDGELLEQCAPALVNDDFDEPGAAARAAATRPKPRKHKRAPVDGPPTVDLRLDDEFAHLLQQGLRSRDTTAVKFALLVLKRAVGIAAITPTKPVILRCAYAQARTDWTHFFRLFDGLRERSGHLVEPLLGEVAAFPIDRMHPSWFQLLLEVGLRVDNVAVRKRVLETVMQLPDATLATIAGAATSDAALAAFWLDRVYGEALTLSHYAMGGSCGNHASAFGEQVAAFTARLPAATASTRPLLYPVLLRNLLHQCVCTRSAPVSGFYVLCGLSRAILVPGAAAPWGADEIAALVEWLYRARRSPVQSLGAEANIRALDAAGRLLAGNVGLAIVAPLLEAAAAGSAAEWDQSATVKRMHQVLGRAGSADDLDDALASHIGDFIHGEVPGLHEKAAASAATVMVLCAVTRTADSQQLRAGSILGEFLAQVHRHSYKPRTTIHKSLHLLCALHDFWADKRDAWANALCVILGPTWSPLAADQLADFLLDASARQAADGGDGSWQTAELYLQTLACVFYAMDAHHAEIRLREISADILSTLLRPKAVAPTDTARFRAIFLLRLAAEGQAAPLLTPEALLQLADSEIARRPGAAASADCWGQLITRYAEEKWTCLALLDVGANAYTRVMRDYDTAHQGGELAALDAFLHLAGKCAVPKELHLAVSEWLTAAIRAQNASNMRSRHGKNLLRRLGQAAVRVALPPHAPEFAGIAAAPALSEIMLIGETRTELVPEVAREVRRQFTPLLDSKCDAQDATRRLGHMASVLLQFATWGPRRSLADVDAPDAHGEFRARVQCLSLLLRLRPSLPGHLALGTQLVTMAFEEYCSTPLERTGMPNTAEHHRHVRLWVLVTLLLHLVTKDAARSLVKQGLAVLPREGVWATRLYAEWMLARLLLAFPDQLEQFYAALRTTALVGRAMTSLATVVCHLLPHLRNSDREPLANAALPALAASGLAKQFSCRTYSQFALDALATAAERWEIAVPDALLPSVAFLRDHPDAKRGRAKFAATYLFGNFDAVRDVTVAFVTNGLLAIGEVTESERLATSAFAKVEPRDPPCVPLHGSLAWQDPAWDRLPMRAGDLSDPSAPVSSQADTFDVPEAPITLNNDDASLVPTQRKITPWQTLLETDADISRLALVDTDSSSRARTRTPLIVCATLVARSANLGGLCRTCEIFAADRLVVPDRRIMQDPTFKALAVTADRWCPVDEVSEPQLLDYLMQKRAEGYALVGLEQTTGSVALDSFEFPECVVLVLGKEREGIPAPVLAVLDHFVEIPQYGLVRSLNVHVSGALLIYAYTQQIMRQRSSLRALR